MEDQNRQFGDLLEAQKQEFLSVMSHELRTPMTGVKGYLSMILEGDAGEVSEEVKEYIAEAYVANDCLIRLVNRMMRTVAVQDGRIRPHVQKVDLSEQLKLLVNDFQIPAKEKNLELRIKNQELGNPIYINTDPDLTREILLNLISNAIKFTQKGEIVIGIENDERFTVVHITDTGIGIKNEDQQRVFEIFNKENLALRGQEKGTGLGLFLARRLAEVQGGNVWLEKSEVGKGSTFCASFPLLTN